MKIYIDESGPFGGSTSRTTGNGLPINQYNTLAAVVIPEKSEASLQELMRRLRGRYGSNKEVKLKDFSNDDAPVIEFIGQLGDIGALAFYAATDLSKMSALTISQRRQKIMKSLENLLAKQEDAAEKSEVIRLIKALNKLRAPLFLQMRLQVHLSERVVHGSTDYFAINDPETLSSFDWLLDTKQSKDYMDAYKYSIRSFFKVYDAETPRMRSPLGNYRYLDIKYGVDFDANAYPPPTDTATSIAKVMYGNLSYGISHESVGLQAADLLASSYRRCLSGNFTDNAAVARSLGALTLQDPNGPPHTGGTVVFGANQPLSETASECIRVMHDSAKD